MFIRGKTIKAQCLIKILIYRGLYCPSFQLIFPLNLFTYDKFGLQGRNKVKFVWIKKKRRNNRM